MDLNNFFIDSSKSNNYLLYACFVCSELLENCYSKMNMDVQIKTESIPKNPLAKIEAFHF